MRAREQALRDKEERLRHRADEELETRVRAARQDIDKVVDDLRARGRPADRRGAAGGRCTAGPSRPARPARREPRRARRSSRSPSGCAKGRSRRRRRRRPATARRARGRRPRRCCGALGLEGRVDRRSTTATPRSTCAASGCARALARTAACVGRAAAARQPRASTSTCRCSARDGAADRDQRDRLHGRRGAQPRVERFLDDLLLTDERQVRIIHGHGTGPAAPGDRRVPAAASAGGDATSPRRTSRAAAGVTVVELKD